MKKGFTILELLVVIMVIAILLGIALPRFKGMQDEGNIAKAKAELRTLQVALESFYIHNSNSYPGTLSSMTAVTPNVVTAIPNDPFIDIPAFYAYARGGTNNKYYVVYSIGTGGNGSAVVFADNTIVQTNPASCIFISNANQDTQP